MRGHAAYGIHTAYVSYIMYVMGMTSDDDGGVEGG